MPILEKKIVIFGKMIVFTLDNNDALGGRRLGGELRATQNYKSI